MKRLVVAVGVVGLVAACGGNAAEAVSPANDQAATSQREAQADREARESRDREAQDRTKKREEEAAAKAAKDGKAAEEKAQVERAEKLAAEISKACVDETDAAKCDVAELTPNQKKDCRESCKLKIDLLDGSAGLIVKSVVLDVRVDEKCASKNLDAETKRKCATIFSDEPRYAVKEQPNSPIMRRVAVKCSGKALDVHEREACKRLMSGKLFAKGVPDKAVVTKVEPAKPVVASAAPGQAPVTGASCCSKCGGKYVQSHDACEGANDCFMCCMGQIPSSAPACNGWR